MKYWFFNTNETYSPSAYKKMFIKDDGLISLYGYGYEKNLKDAKKGQKVLAYVNKKGIMAVGTVISDSPILTSRIFSKDVKDEYSLKVEWEAILPEKLAFKPSEAIQIGYPLPVRSTFCKLYNTILAEKIYKEVVVRHGKIKKT